MTFIVRTKTRKDFLMNVPKTWHETKTICRHKITFLAILITKHQQLKLNFDRGRTKLMKAFLRRALYTVALEQKLCAKLMPHQLSA